MAGFVCFVDPVVAGVGFGVAAAVVVVVGADGLAAADNPAAEQVAAAVGTAAPAHQSVDFEFAAETVADLGWMDPKSLLKTTYVEDVNYNTSGSINIFYC